MNLEKNTSDFTKKSDNSETILCIFMYLKERYLAFIKEKNTAKSFRNMI